jgi:exosome complex component CSL4
MMSMSDNRLVLPGEEIGTTEEYLPGPGTYEDGGKIFAAVAGVLTIDTKEMATRVRPLNPPVKLKIGDIVLGRVDDVRSQMVSVELVALLGKDRAISDQGAGTIHVSHVSEHYTEDTGAAYQVLDIVRAKVISTSPSVQLATAGSDFGVVKALCSKCRKALTLKGEELFCEHCQKGEPRKIARFYGSIDLLKPPTKEEMAKDQQQYTGEMRRGGHGGGRGGGFGRGGGGRGGDRRGGGGGYRGGGGRDGGRGGYGRGGDRRGGGGGYRGGRDGGRGRGSYRRDGEGGERREGGDSPPPQQQGGQDSAPPPSDGQ